ncbi:hypothetical protein BC829DRAFT_421431 [Chytridium lagenaria]|nr:hypothetical protein BC829DRAFT_421431 [Chytridium lagenaria]
MVVAHPLLSNHQSRRSPLLPRPSHLHPRPSRPSPHHPQNLVQIPIPSRPSRRFSDEDDDLLFDPDSELARNTLENSKSGTAISSLRLYIAERSLDDDSDDEDEEEDLDRQYLLSQAAFSGVTPNTIRAVDDVPEDYDADEDDPEVLCDDSDDVPDVPERLVPQPTQAPTPSPSPDNVLTATAEISSLLSTSSGSSDPAVAAESHPETLPRKSSASSINSYLYHLHKTVEHRDSSSSLLKMRKEVDVDRMDGIRRPSPMGRVGSHASLVALSVGNSGTVVVLPSDVVANAVSTDPTTHTPHPKIRKISSVISKASTASSFSESSTSSAGDAGTAIITPTPNLVSPLARRPPAVIEALVEDEEREFGSVSLDVSTTTELRRRANVTMPTSQAEILARQLRMTTSKDELVGAHGGEVAGRMRVLRRVTTNPNVSAAVAVAAGVVEGGGYTSDPENGGEEEEGVGKIAIPKVDKVYYEEEKKGSAMEEKSGNVMGIGLPSRFAELIAARPLPRPWDTRDEILVSIGAPVRIDVPPTPAPPPPPRRRGGMKKIATPYNPLPTLAPLRHHHAPHVSAMLNPTTPTTSKSTGFRLTWADEIRGGVLEVEHDFGDYLGRVMEIREERRRRRRREMEMGGGRRRESGGGILGIFDVGHTPMYSFG